MGKRILLGLGLLFCCFWSASAQQKIIRGKVTAAEDGTTLPGVSVVVKGSTTGTVTDGQGSYQLNLPETAKTLVFSFVGYASQEINIGNASTIDAKLGTDTKQLSEVVVTAAGIQREKKALGYSVSTIKSSQLQQVSEPDPLRALSGKVAGVNIQGSGGAAGGATNITIRGNSSLSNNNQPLFVVDGVPFDNSTFNTDGGFSAGATFTNRAFDLDPNNIESMTVLKGAAAAALYGSRAANGAIIITTKNGKIKSKKGLEIAYNTSYSTEKIAASPEYQTTYGQGTEWDTRLGVFGSWGAPYSAIDSIPHPLANRFGAVFPEFVGKRVKYEPFGQGNFDNFYERGHVYENAISIQGGGEKASISAGISRMDNKGIVPFNNINRTSLNLGGQATLDNGLYINGTINYVSTNQESPQLSSSIGSGPSAIEIMPWTPTSYDLTGYPYRNPITGASIYDRFGIDNPYWAVESSPYTSKVDRYFGKFTAGIDATSWLNLQATIGFNGYNDRRRSVNGRGGEIFPNGNVTDDNIYRQELDWTFLATITRDLTPNWNMRLILGQNANQRVTDRQAVFGDGIIVPGINDLDNTRVQQAIGGGLVKQRFIAHFADLQFSHKDMFFVNLVGRNDVSSTLAKGNRSYYYGGINGSVILSDWLNLKSKTINFLKVRGGITQVGNEASAYQTQTVFSINPTINNPSPIDTGTPFNGVNTMTQGNRLGSSALQPEKITEIEVGVEAKLFNNRVGIDFAWYNKVSSDQIFTVDLPGSSGYLTRVVNLGKVRNRGLELGLDLTPVLLSNGFKWNIYTAFTLNRNIVLDLGGPPELTYSTLTGSVIGSMHVVGRPYGLIRGDVYVRDDEGNLLVNPRTGKAIIADRQAPVGDPNPRFFFGVTNSISYKGFSFSALVDYRDGGDLLSVTMAEMLARGSTRDTEDRNQVLVPQGVLGDPITRLPILSGDGKKQPNNIPISVNEFFFGTGAFAGSQGTADEFRVWDASVIRLREVSMAYQIPAKWLAKTPFGSASISLSGRNLWFKAPNFPKYMNLDPEVNSLGVGNAQGFELVSIPTTRRFGVNLRVTF
ncbi:MAG: SusC/RagA family TonB-linked outer membrane protein [Cytophagia bacterium]|nr:MAG: SusC/RagA family TonB-linked outer membrane protein [Runella sp.]TAG16763.1 MAG: SusC/RagA family TonB-linked outer membrane protein [Cytophagales bacterium]TAG35851.1 MAG: SusC/RagA family TonB-linked outer membrane protein [Cytophagia bacterium]TAG77601.1 MAG: SusC/RagA family TonB-linked outer membrane protein [Cytophagales bacterium]